MYLKKERTFKFNGMNLKVNPGVFHPAFYFSSKIFAQFIKSLKLNNKRVLDLGTGSGILALTAAKYGGNVIASDISELAIRNTKLNAEQNDLNISIIKSDLFDEFNNQKFDYIFINPPYYAKNPKNESEFAWYCGSEFQYFSKLFKQFPDFIHDDSMVYMILSESCDLNRIKQISTLSRVKLYSLMQKKIFLEKFIIFEIKIY